MTFIWNFDNVVFYIIIDLENFHYSWIVSASTDVRNESKFCVLLRLFFHFFNAFFEIYHISIFYWRGLNKKQQFSEFINMKFQKCPVISRILPSVLAWEISIYFGIIYFGSPCSSPSCQYQHCNKYLDQEGTQGQRCNLERTNHKNDGIQNLSSSIQELVWHRS